MKRAGIIANSNRPVVRQLMPELIRFLLSQSGRPVLSANLARMISEEEVQEDRLIVVPTDEFVVQEVDWIIAIGGDGTLLRTARLVGTSGLPILGVNSGKLGFMMQTTPDDLENAVRRVFEGKYTLDKRQVLQGGIDNSSPLRKDRDDKFFALNDIVIDKGSICRVIELSIFINDQFVNNVLADGLIVSTPTGSTAYSLAAGGPIVAPDMEAIVVSPICPHTLSNRAMVLSAQDRIRIEVKADHPDLLLTVDGQENVAVQPGSTIEVYCASHNIHLIRFTESSFYDVLRTKLKWGER